MLVWFHWSDSYASLESQVSRLMAKAHQVACSNHSKQLKTKCNKTNNSYFEFILIFLKPPWNSGNTNPFLPETHLGILLCLMPDDFTRQRETPWAAEGY